ncbi:MAG TPA: hypothetical protein VG326_20325 [Tepidisphaeraceae bacterium]|jgi:c-di-GMP-binding flagellar brake protein YcgR|nr:hypothetical protein [Tepidisphaeraceae bacterium]
MTDPRREMLNEAVARNCAVVISLPSAGILRHYKSRFIGETPIGIWVEAEPAEHALIGELLTTQSNVGVSFKRGPEKVTFLSPLLEYDARHSINDQTTIAALLIARPAEIKTLQRRNNYRVKVFKDNVLQGKIWRVAPRAHITDRPMPSQQVTIDVRDLSLGGMGVAIRGNNGEPPKISTEDRLRIELQHGQITLLLEGRMRQPSGPQPPGEISTGIRFNEMAGDFEGRQKLSQLTRIISEMQRQEVRRVQGCVG